MAAKSFDAAIEAFESALRIVPADAGPVRADVERRLFAASQSRETARRFAALFAEAQEANGRGDLPAAHRLASEAAALDPASTEAAALSQQLAAEIERREAEEERQRQEHLRRQETISSVTQAVRGHVNAKRYTEALKLVEGALGQYPGDEILQKVGAAVQEARRRYVAELEAERRQAIERQRQAEEQLRLLEAESGESRLEEKPSPAQTPAPPDRPSVGRTPPSARDPLVAPLPSPPTRTPDRTPARLAPPQSRPGRRTIILAAAGLLALVLVFLLWPHSEEVQQPQLAGLQDAIPEAISTHRWQQAEASIAQFQQLVPADPRAAKWSKQVEAGRALDALRSSIQDAIRQKDWATAEAQIKDLLGKAPYDPQIPIWQAQVIAGRKANQPVKKEPAQEHQAELAEAERQLEQGHYQAAIDLFQRVLQQDRGNARAQSGLKKARDAKKLEDSVFGGGH
jgi:tetratricopeptide (TPR) repeat protein